MTANRRRENIARLEKQRSLHRKETAGRQMGRIAEIHSEKVVKTELNPTMRTPAASHQGAIYLNWKVLPAPESREAIATWIGVTMHEVGHIEWSPNPENLPGGETARRYWNILEDNRQENLLVGELPGVAAPLTRAVTDLILGHTAHPASQWPLVAGRLYLPDKMRNAVYRATVATAGRAWADAVRRVVLDYIQLPDPGYSDIAVASTLVGELQRLMKEQRAELSPHGCESTGSDDAGVGAVDPEALDTLDVHAADDVDPEQQEQKSEPSEGGEESGESGSEDAEDDAETQSGSGDGGAGESAEESAESGGGDSSDEGGDEGGDTAGTGTGNGQTPTPSQARNDAMKAIEEARADATEKMAPIIDAVVDRIRGEDPGTLTRGLVEVTPDARQAATRLLAELKPLFDDAEAGLDRFTSKGRIRPDRMARGYRPDISFDKWQQDMEDDVSAEIIVALDTSGSMSTWTDQLANAVWVLRQVTERSAAKLTIVSWDTQAEVMRLQPINNRHTDMIYRGGGTSAIPMLNLVETLFAESRFDRKWLLVMTDGQITENPEQIKPYLERLKASGVVITPIGFGQRSEPHVFGDNAQRIDRLNEIPKKIGAMLYDLYRKNAIR